MDEQKRNRLAAAITVNAIILFVILLTVIISQLVVMVQLKNKRNDIKRQAEEYARKIEEKEDNLEYLQSEQGLRDLAFGYGYYFKEG